MKPSLHIQAELSEIAPHLAAIASQQMPHAVPEGYFESLPALLLLRSSQPSGQPAVPEGYFDTLPGLMLQKVRQQEVAAELESVAPLLNTISKSPVHHVPEGYFDNLIPQKPVAEPRRIGTVRSMWSRIMPYAAAACLALGLWVGYQWLNKEQTELPADTVASTENIEQALQQIDAQSIASYLESNSAVTTYASLEAVTNDVESLLQGMDSESLEQYLKTMPTLNPTEKSNM